MLSEMSSEHYAAYCHSIREPNTNEGRATNTHCSNTYPKDVILLEREYQVIFMVSVRMCFCA